MPGGYLLPSLKPIHWHSASTHGLSKDKNPTAVIAGVGFGPAGSSLNVAHEVHLLYGWSHLCFSVGQLRKLVEAELSQSSRVTGLKAVLFLFLRTNMCGQPQCNRLLW